ncbi:MAG: phage tail tape measure protein [Flavobacterium lindanitolerans]|uniref:phage tail tape measure protein n=1 Tax=Flavobacterium lindanitolerans TaxID=428988 RepID=UPI001A5F628F|nr:phage tail tape measure protein [Flavobacterium lindanitolerans]MBL7868870.1 phage tail tape measure protein [Flavobacterium lindanitolerans]
MGSKLELLMELKNKLFNSKLRESTEKLGKAADAMKAKLRGLTENVVKGFKHMTAQVPLFGQAVELLGNPYVMIASGIVAVTGFLATATNEAAKFDASFLNIRNLNLDKSQESLRDYKALILDTAFATGQNAVTTADSMYAMQSALDVYGKDAAKIFADVAKFSTATGAGLEDTMDSVSKAIKAFGLTAADTQNILTGFSKVDQIGLTTLKEFTQVQTEFAGAAASAGQKIDTANKIFAGFTTIAKNSQIAATMTKGAFDGLTQKNTVEGLKSIGIAMYDAKGNMKNLESIIVQVDKKFKGMSSQKIDELINKIGGNEGLRALLTKIKTGADDFISMMESYDSSSFDLDKALKNAKGDFTTLTGIVKNKFNTVMIKLGEKILPSVAHGLEFVERILDKVYKNLDLVILVVKKAVIAFTVFKVTNMLVASSVGKIALAFGGGLTNGIRAATASMKAFNAAFKTNMIGIITSLIATLAMSIGDLQTKSENFQKFLEKEKDFDQRRSDMLKNTRLDLGKSKVGSLTKSQASEIKSAAQGRMKEMDDAMVALKAQLQNPGTNVNAKNVNRLYQELQAEKMKNQTYPYVQANIKKIQSDIDANIRELTGGFTIRDLMQGKKDNEGILKGLSGRKLIEDDKDSKATGEQIGSVSEKASQPRSIVINIGSLNSGGINTTQTTLSKKTPEEIEEWFNEAMMRVVRGVELSYE